MTVTLRLFRADEPARLLETRTLEPGAELRIGRDVGQDWALDDPGRLLSRAHLVLTLEGEAVAVTDVSANGVSLADGDLRLPQGRPTPVPIGSVLRFGPYLLRLERSPVAPFAPVDKAASASRPSNDDGRRQAWEPRAGYGGGFDAPFQQPMLRGVDVSRHDLAVPSEWEEALASPAWTGASSPRPAPAAIALVPPEPPPAPASAPQAFPAVQDLLLLEAFCRGAKLDPASFARIEPEELMARAGVIYRQMILGMSDLMGERTSLKTEYRMTRTTVRADNNNPFKWLPPQTVATQLLLEPEEGFVGGPEAVTGAFRDLKKHLLCLLAGLRATLAATLDALSPKHVEEDLEGRSMMMKNRDAEAWREYGRRHGELRKAADSDADGALNREFRAAYERQLIELDRVSPS